MRHYLTLMRLDKPIGLLLLLWPTLSALWLASKGRPDPFLISLFIAGVILMRSAGCVINDMADWQFDQKVTRTRTRPLATGALTRRQAAPLFLFLLLAAASLLFFLNSLTRSLAIAGALLAIIYPFLKRVTSLPQAGLGVAFSWGVPMAFTASMGTLPAKALWPFIATFFWTVMYDTLYAMADQEDDLKAGVRSTAILAGNQDKTLITGLQLATLLSLTGTGYAFHLHTCFDISLCLVALLFLYQHWLIRQRDPAQCIRAFYNNQWVGLIIFGGVFFSC